MKTVYLDELFLLNLVINYFLLLATAKICALPFRRARFALAAALGGLWSCLSLLPALAFLRAALLHPVLGLFMTLAAFGRERRIFRCFFAFLGVSALFAGAVWAAGLYRGILSPSGPFFRLDMRVLVISFAACWALVSLVFRRAAARAGAPIHTVTLERNGRTASFRALRDTGNGLYDPLSGCGALIAEPEALEALFDPADAAQLRAPPAEAMLRIPGMRLLPWSGLDGKSRLLLAFRPDRITVDGAERADLIAAVAPAGLGGAGSYQALI